jgi:DNA-binding MarR family transcriptional regulator
MSQEPVGPDPIGEPQDIDRIIHEPARLRLVALLSVVDEADFVFLQRQTGLTGGNLSTHVSRLESAGYVHVEKGYQGKRPRTSLSLTETGRQALARYRRTLDSLLNGVRE